MRSARVILILGSLLALLQGCDERPARRGCGAEVVSACQCEGGGWGTRSCGPSGAAGPCSCDHRITDGGPPSSDTSPSSGTVDGWGTEAPDALAASDAAPQTSPDSGSPTGPALINAPARILCVGDSITAAPEAWIYPLQDLLRKDGCAYQLIGLDHEPYDGQYKTKSGYDNLRVAVGGFSSRGVLNWIKEQGMGGTPDIIIEYLGVNNVYGGYIDGKYNPDVTSDPGGAFVQDMGELLSLARAQNPRVATILAKIQENQLPQITTAIAQVVAQHQSATSPLFTAGAATGVETSDGIHPTAAGATKLAAKLYEVLGPLLKSHQLCN